MWITEFRERFGIGLEQLGMQIRRLGAKKSPPLRVSDTLLERLERDPRFKTVPALADLIAEACAATAAQRDELVLKRYRGTWKPPKRRKPPVVVARPIKVAKPSEAGRPPANGAARGVVKVDRYGAEVGRYRGCGAAARENLIEPRQVTARCHREYRTDEFKAHGYTFRFADEWDAMTEAQRREDVERLNGVSGARGGHTSSRMIKGNDNGKESSGGACEVYIGDGQAAGRAGEEQGQLRSGRGRIPDRIPAGPPGGRGEDHGRGQEHRGQFGGGPEGSGEGQKREHGGFGR